MLFIRTDLSFTVIIFHIYSIFEVQKQSILQ